jgi:hypothetical protein
MRPRPHDVEEEVGLPSMHGVHGLRAGVRRCRQEPRSGSPPELEHVASGRGSGAWVAMRAGGAAFEFASAMSFAVVRSDEGTTFYLSSAFGS